MNYVGVQPQNFGQISISQLCKANVRITLQVTSEFINTGMSVRPVLCGPPRVQSQVNLHHGFPGVFTQQHHFKLGMQRFNARPWYDFGARQISSGGQS